MLKSLVSDAQEHVGHEPKNVNEAGRVHQAYRRADAGASWLRADYHRAPKPTQGATENPSRYIEFDSRNRTRSR
jgi:hypothetical protein